jgi:hypothetical protein
MSAQDRVPSSYVRRRRRQGAVEWGAHALGALEPVGGYGLEAHTVRRLGQERGQGPMGLYRHVWAPRSCWTVFPNWFSVGCLSVLPTRTDGPLGVLLSRRFVPPGKDPVWMRHMWTAPWAASLSHLGD